MIFKQQIHLKTVYGNAGHIFHWFYFRLIQIWPGGGGKLKKRDKKERKIDMKF